MASYNQATEREFLQQNRITQENWVKSDISWKQLQAIAADHDHQKEMLRDSAELIARVVQRIPTVHSVRWRIKDTDHLLTKIVRKRAEAHDKYKDINESNYFEKVTDLIGLRALHLFKEDCLVIGEHLQRTWETTETPLAYIRQGDPQELLDKFTAAGLQVKVHTEGYRSIHYIVSTQPMARTVFAEIQVRTIFEEGWSEIDHRVRYPNYSDDPQVSYFLTIFNRLAGSADEMGTFVQGLAQSIDFYNKSLETANQQKDEALQRLEKIAGELEDEKQQGKRNKAVAASLQAEIKKLRKIYSPIASDPFLPSQMNGDPSSFLFPNLSLSERERLAVARLVGSHKGVPSVSDVQVVSNVVNRVQGDPDKNKEKKD